MVFVESRAGDSYIGRTAYAVVMGHNYITYLSAERVALVFVESRAGDGHIGRDCVGHSYMVYTSTSGCRFFYQAMTTRAMAT